MEEILSIASRSSDGAEVFQITSSRTPVQFEANRLKHIQTKESVSTALRIVKSGRVGFAQASGNIKPAELVNMALETCQFGHQANYRFPSRTPYKDVEVYDTSVERFSIVDMVDTGQTIIDAVRSHTPEIICEGAISRSTATCRIANTSGGQVSYHRSNFSISMDGMLVRDGDILYVGDILSSCHPVKEYKGLIDEIIRQLTLARHNASIRSGTFPVIFTPFGVSGALLSPLISAFNGKTVLDGASPLKDKQGAHVFDSKFSFYDDPTIPFQPGSTPCDDEGVPAVKNTLVEKGNIVQFYYDLHTAALAGTESTGNGIRNGGLPSPAPHALIINAGVISREDMIKQVREGLIIEQLMGAEQGNILNGDFSGNVLLGYKIENGEISGRVKDTMIHGNVYQLLREVAALGSDARWIAGVINTPSIYCPAISVSAKS